MHGRRGRVAVAPGTRARRARRWRGQGHGGRRGERVEAAVARRRCRPASATPHGEYVRWGEIGIRWRENRKKKEKKKREEEKM